ncbi:conserved hypothetical protein [Desulfatibacillum aliphaticivorans]|uniref:Mu-like prophage FluMu protein gp28 n=1 Tax=Desulfatibacillum aliphaticivorans TaxID=218208 RepID=B8FC40_DESAL|nr:hypothetical protein [Desulfatibacillum aliphaticivorans]ACL05245.1 conserved hypothetical protein [Desulfatibacillum aliphaticivorans]
MKGYQGKENRTRRTPAAFLGYQQRWSGDKSRVKVWQKSRRIGASWDEAGEDTLLAASENGMDVFYIGYNKDMAQEFIEDCADWARFFNQAAGEIEEFLFEDEADEKKHILAFRIRFKSGFKIVALSSRPANLRGKQGKIVIDEAAFHDDLAGLIKAAMAMLMWGGSVVIISTHNGVDNPFNELIEAIKAGKKPYSLHTTTLDDAIQEGLYDRVCLRLGKEWTQEGQDAWRKDIVDFYGDDADEELFVIPAQGADIYLHRTLVLSCMSPDIPVYRWKCKDSFVNEPEHVREKAALEWCEENLKPHLDQLDPNLKTYFGEDFGRTGDLTNITPLQEQPGLKYHAPFIVELRNAPFDQQRQVLFYVLDRLPRFTGGAMDSRGNGQYLAEVAMQRYGAMRIQQIMISQAWYLEAMPKYKKAFEEKEILTARDSDILEDHRSVKMKKGVAKVPDDYRTKGSDGGQRHGDAAIGGCMAWYAVQNIDGVEMESESTGVKRASTQLSGFMG